MKLLAVILAAFAALAAAVPTATDNSVAARDDTSINTANVNSRGYDPNYLGPCQKQGCLHCCKDRFTPCEHCACGPTAHWPPENCEEKGSASSLETLQVREPVDISPIPPQSVDVSPIPEPILAVREPRECDSLCHKYKCCRDGRWCRCSLEQLAAFEAAAELDASVLGF